ncbi:hypothetical protein HanXRQr2_Chr11g0499621 [Helianthus annuus]|uniref:Uncharacterized protein n=1 Tax=Helianthus annuus TaxID=4232 RepID=A0A9K3N160_HELAN|nr:hypothetical protein HanXRQr2_Chr11g0499621 [Helianthus annuus]KAJ0875844.1 hypothetical protein HanPSC8_Chr11g0481361 [Helianthus annuus]
MNRQYQWLSPNLPASIIQSMCPISASTGICEPVFKTLNHQILGLKIHIF